MRKNSKPLVQINFLVNDDGKDSTAPIQVGSLAWYDWLARHDGFLYEGKAGHFSARAELRRGIRYWYGYRRRAGRLSKTYLGKPEELTSDRLEQASAILAGQFSSKTAFNEIAGESNPESAVVIGSPQGTAEITHLSLTKFKPPALPQKLYSRPRLIQRINAPATLISAPSGFGKTTLVNEWRQYNDQPVAWAALGADDNQPQRFWSTLVMALQTINPSFGQGWLSQLHSASPPSLLNTVVDLTNDIIRVTDGINGPGICLVLDDFHNIQRTEIHASLQTWLEQIPPKFQLIITSNFKLPLTLGYLRAKGTVVELKADDLRFTLEEGVDFLKQHTFDKSLSSSEMQTLVRRTEGWVAGLVLAASILSQQENRSKVMEIFTGAHAFLQEFFMESVLRQQCPEIKKFLLKTSILEQLNGPLCNAVTGRRDSGDMLARLWEESLFLERLEKPGWYRYHEMFAEMLRTQLQEQFPAEISHLHRKAAKWYRTQASLAEAINHLLLGKAWEDAAVLIEALAPNELEQLGEDSRLLRWLQQLPEAVVQQHRTLLGVYLRLARLGLPPKEVQDFLSRTETSFTSQPAAKKTSSLDESLTETQRIRFSPTTIAQEMPESQPTKEDDAVGQMLDGILRYQYDSRFDPVKAEAEASEVYQAALARNHLFSILMAGGACANLAYSQGHLRRSEQIANKVLQRANEFRTRLPGPASIALTALSGVYFERNQFAQAQQLLDRAVEVQPEPVGTNEAINMAILRAKIQSMHGESEAAIETIEAIRELNSRHSSNIWLDQDLIAYQALFRLHQGDFTAAERVLGGGWEIDKNPFSAFVRASMLIDQNRSVAAEEILRHLLDRYPNSFYWVPTLRVRVQLSFALFNQQKVNQARQIMAEAARIAAPEFFVRPFLSTDPQTPSLLALVLHTEDINPGTRSFIKGVLAMVGQGDGIRKTSSQDGSVSLALAASISPREQEILKLISTGLSNQEIADKCSISSSTVKTHIENIYRKLGVNSRMQAISQAQILSLV